MATLPYAITTKEKVKLLGGISGTTNDTLIDMLIDQVTDMIESICGRRFFSTEYTDEEYDSPDQGDKIFLKNKPITELASVQYRGGTISSPTWIDFDANSYLLYGARGYVKFFTVFTKGYLNLRFTYTAGYLIDWAEDDDPEAHTLPRDLTMVATQLVLAAYNKRSSGGIQSQSTEGQSITYADISKDDLNDYQKSVINRYKKFRL